MAPVAFAWGLVGGTVVRGAPLSAASAASLTRPGWNPLVAFTWGGRQGGDDDDAAAEGDDDPTSGGDAPEQGRGCGRQPAQPAAGCPLVAPGLRQGGGARRGAAMAAGWDHEVRVDAAGRVSVRGWNEHGEADPDAFGERRIDGWRPLPGLAYVCVVQVAAGERHSLALADDGRVFYWGERCSAAEAPAAASAPQAQEQVGAGGAGGARLQRASDGDDRGIDGDLTGVTPVTCVAGPGTAAPERVSQVAAGGRHSLALTASGAVLAWGSNLQGQCAVDRKAAAVDVQRPTRVAALGGVPIASIAAGAGHSAAVSRDGAAYAWGCGLDGALGAGLATRGDPLLSRRSRRRRTSGGGSEDAARGGGGPSRAGLGASSAVPLLMEGPGLDEEDVVQVACGARHTLLRCASGAVYATGWNRYGACCCCCSDGGGGGGGGDAAAGYGEGAAGDAAAGGLAAAWCCRHGEAIYRPTRVQLPGQPKHPGQPGPVLQQLDEEQGEAAAESRAGEPQPWDVAAAELITPRLGRAGGGGGSSGGGSSGQAAGGAAAGGPKASYVFAGPWHSVICVA